VRFFYATFGAGVVAAQRPITCPKRQLQRERYAKCVPMIFKLLLTIFIKYVINNMEVFMFFSKNIFLKTHLLKKEIKNIVFSIIATTFNQPNDGKIFENDKECDFIIRRNINRMPQYIPIIKGKIFEYDNINIINLKISIPISSRIFLSIIFGMVIIGLPLSLIVLPIKVITSLISSIFIILILMLSQYNFQKEYKEAKEYLVGLFKAEEIKYKKGTHFA
jgi:hypothetical protein